MSPRQVEPPSGAASADSINCQSEPTAQEDTPIGASSAESAPQSSPSPPASKYEHRPEFNVTLNNSVWSFGSSSGNTYNFGKLGRSMIFLMRYMEVHPCVQLHSICNFLFCHFQEIFYFLQQLVMSCPAGSHCLN